MSRSINNTYNQEFDDNTGAIIESESYQRLLSHLKAVGNHLGEKKKYHPPSWCVVGIQEVACFLNEDVFRYDYKSLDPLFHKMDQTLTEIENELTFTQNLSSQASKIFYELTEKKLPAVGSSDDDRRSALIQLYTLADYSEKRFSSRRLKKEICQKLIKTLSASNHMYHSDIYTSFRELNHDLQKQGLCSKNREYLKSIRSELDRLHSKITGNRLDVEEVEGLGMVLFDWKKNLYEAKKSRWFHPSAWRDYKRCLGTLLHDLPSFDQFKNRSSRRKCDYAKRDDPQTSERKRRQVRPMFSLSESRLSSSFDLAHFQSIKHSLQSYQSSLKTNEKIDISEVNETIHAVVSRLDRVLSGQQIPADFIENADHVSQALLSYLSSLDASPRKGICIYQGKGAMEPKVCNEGGYEFRVAKEIRESANQWLEGIYTNENSNVTDFCKRLEREFVDSDSLNASSISRNEWKILLRKGTVVAFDRVNKKPFFLKISHKLFRDSARIPWDDKRMLLHSYLFDGECVLRKSRSFSPKVTTSKRGVRGLAESNGSQKKYIQLTDIYGRRHACLIGVGIAARSYCYSHNRYYDSEVKREYPLRSMLEDKGLVITKDKGLSLDKVSARDDMQHVGSFYHVIRSCFNDLALWHASNRVHGDVKPANICLDSLIDYPDKNTSILSQTMLSGNASDVPRTAFYVPDYGSPDQRRSHPDVSGVSRMPLTCSTDIYAACKSFLVVLNSGAHAKVNTTRFHHGSIQESSHVVRSTEDSSLAWEGGAAIPSAHLPGECALNLKKMFPARETEIDILYQFIIDSFKSEDSSIDPDLILESLLLKSADRVFNLLDNKQSVLYPTWTEELRTIVYCHFHQIRDCQYSSSPFLPTCTTKLFHSVVSAFNSKRVKQGSTISRIPDEYALPSARGIARHIGLMELFANKKDAINQLYKIINLCLWKRDGVIYSRRILESILLRDADKAFGLVNRRCANLEVIKSLVYNHFHLVKGVKQEFEAFKRTSECKQMDETLKLIMAFSDSPETAATARDLRMGIQDLSFSKNQAELRVTRDAIFNAYRRLLRQCGLAHSSCLFSRTSHIKKMIRSYKKFKMTRRYPRVLSDKYRTIFERLAFEGNQTRSFVMPNFIAE